MNSIKQIITLLSLSFCISVLHGQTDTIKKGAYLGATFFHRNKPMYESTFRFIKEVDKVYDENYHLEMSDFEKNLYRVKSSHPRIPKRKLHNYIWGIYYEETFYLNANKIGMGKGYIKIGKLKPYSYFRGKPVMTVYQEYLVRKSAFEFGLLGSGITSAAIAQKNKDQIHYILNSQSGIVHLLDEQYVLDIMEPYPDLVRRYYTDLGKGSLETLLRYIELVNKKLQ